MGKGVTSMDNAQLIVKNQNVAETIEITCRMIDRWYWQFPQMSILFKQYLSESTLRDNKLSATVAGPGN